MNVVQLVVAITALKEAQLQLEQLNPEDAEWCLKWLSQYQIFNIFHHTS